MSRVLKYLPDTGALVKITAPDDINVEQFMTLLEEQGITLDLKKQLLVEKISKVSFLTGDAMLPNGDATLFSLAKDPKGNNSLKIKQLDRKSIYSSIAKHITKDGQRAKDYFNKYGNYTRTSSEDLEKLLKAYKPSKGKASSLPKVTKVNGSKASKTTSKPKKVTRELAEVKAAQKAFRGTIYNKR